MASVEHHLQGRRDSIRGDREFCRRLPPERFIVAVISFNPATQDSMTASCCHAGAPATPFAMFIDRFEFGGFRLWIRVADGSAQPVLVSSNVVPE
jgi:hypothetical protein